MPYSGRYRPTNSKKYRGDIDKIYYRSSWERRFMVYCDRNDKIIEWGSEEVIIPYRSPIDGKIHRYFPDFYIKVKQQNGSIKKMIIEIKPYIQTQPPKTPKKKTPKFLNEVKTWGINQAKWKAASEFCLDVKMEFKILTEHELGV